MASCIRWIGRDLDHIQLMQRLEDDYQIIFSFNQNINNMQNEITDVQAISDTFGRVVIEKNMFGMNDYCSLISAHIVEEVRYPIGTIDIQLGLLDEDTGVIKYDEVLDLSLSQTVSVSTISSLVSQLNTKIKAKYSLSEIRFEINSDNIITIKNTKYTDVLVRMTGNYYKFLGYELTDLDQLKLQNSKYDEKYICINDKTQLGYSYIMQNFYQLQSNQITGSTTVFNQIYNNNSNPYQQFGSNTLHIFYVEEKNYQARQIDFYNRINQNGPIEIQLYDMDNQKINLQFIIQIRLFKQSLFHMKANSEVATNQIKQIEQHNKKCIYLFLEKDQQQFILQQQFRYVSLVYAYGNKNSKIIQNETEKVCSYVCQLKLNNKDFALLTLNRYEIYNQNNNIFVWNEQTTNTNQLQFEFKIIKTLYDGRRIEVEPDEMNFLLLKLYVKE
ncbi:Hypothetical_protein [Hexamita inflata]|uniref:Hypothetical_protein n=1 Tax=Hexamita inflata TaxID=28002 RepID=A0AA86RE49_9EUKA|nr:Hypothetical protein HINF_LOCUS53395 [Hexamita inflata]